MAELREVFEMVTKQVEPDQDSWKQQEQRQRTAVRKRKVWTFAAVAAIAVVAAVLVIRALPGDETQPAAPPEPSVSEGTPGAAELTTDVPFTTYTSTQYGYSIGYPEIFSRREATAPLSNLGLPYDTSETTDYFSATAPEIRDPGLIVAAQPLDPGTTLREWTEKVETFVDPCVLATTQETVTVGGEEATLTYFAGCPSPPAFHYWTTVVHNDMGYHVIWIGNTGDEARDRAVFDRVLQSFQFTD